MNLNLSIRGKLLASFGALLALLAISVVVSSFQITRLEETMRQTQGKEALLGRGQSALWELRYGFPQFLVLTDETNRKKILDAEPRLYATLEESLVLYGKQEGLTDEEKKGLAELQAVFAKYKEARPRWFQLIAENRPDEAAVWRAATTTPLGAATVKNFSDLIDITSRNDRARTDEQIDTAERSKIVIDLLGAVALALGLFAAFAVYRGINRPLVRLQDTIARIGRGEEAARARLDTGDELGALGESFDRLLDDRLAAQRKIEEGRHRAESDKVKAEQENEQLNNSVISILEAVSQLSQRDLTVRAPVTEDLIGTVSDSINLLSEETAKVLHDVTEIAGQVASGSDNVRTQAQLVSKTAADERQSVQQMIASLADATLQMNQVATLAEQSNQHAAQATQVTETALETVNGTVKGMESIRETIAETEKRIKRLGERSQEITGIVNLINTISERTHVLALNASMQAAVAGEAGRGFAVVAEEVQRLAESSRNATQQIGTLVNNIQLETNETIATVNRTISQVVQGSEQAQRAGEQMRRTQAITGALVQQVQRIAASSEQQKEVSAQLLQSVQHIGESTERTALQIESQNKETESLLANARRLVDSVNVFKLPAAA